MSDLDQDDVGVVIVNYRTKELTSGAVRSVLEEPHVREVVVVDNASDDGSAQHLRETFRRSVVRVVESEENTGFGGGANLGVEHCQQPLVFLLNSDATLVPGSMALLRRPIVENETVAVVAPAVYLGDGQILQPGAYGAFPTLRSILLRSNWRPSDGFGPDWVSGVAMLLRREDFVSVEGFDPAFTMYFEDVDLCWRLRSRGKEVRRVAAAGVVHVGGQSHRSSERQLRQALDSRRLYFTKRASSPAVLASLRVLDSLRLLRAGPPVTEIAQRCRGRRRTSEPGAVSDSPPR